MAKCSFVNIYVIVSTATLICFWADVNLCYVVFLDVKLCTPVYLLKGFCYGVETCFYVSYLLLLVESWDWFPVVSLLGNSCSQIAAAKVLNNVVQSFSCANRHLCKQDVCRGGATRGARGTPPSRGGCAAVGEFWQFSPGWLDGPEGWKGRRNKKNHFASSFVITYHNNVLTINALRNAGLQRQGKHA